MKVRGFTLAGPVICVIALLIGVPAALAQGTSSLDVSEEGQTGPATGGGGQQTRPTEYDPDAPPPGADIRTVVAGESEAAAAYAAGDAVTSFNASDIEALGALSVADLADFTPNLEIVTAGSTAPTFFIRGIGLNDFNANSSGAVAIFQDSIAINSPALQLPTFFDLESVDISAGPVGKGAARNASAGKINVFSRKPRGTYNGYLRSSYGKYNYNDFEGAVEAPVYEDILLARAAFRVSHRDGFAKNRCGGMPPAFDPITGQQLRAKLNPGQPSTSDKPYSLCGERVYSPTDVIFPNPAPSGFSSIPANLPTEVNDLGNFATRLTLRYQPTLDQDWLINGHVAKREELSRLGIAYGTNGIQEFPDGSQLEGLLGNFDGQGTGISNFRRPEVLAMRAERQAILKNAYGYSDSEALFASQIATANEIGPNLDIDPYSGYYNKVGETRNLTYGTYIRGDVALPGDLTLKTISAYDAYERFVESDTDQSPNVLFEITTEDQGWQFYQNLEVGGALEGLPLEWTVGAYYLQESLDVKIDNDFGRLATSGGVANREYTQDTWSFGAYTGLEWNFWDDFTLDGGARYNWDKKEIDYALKSGAASSVSIKDFQTRTRTAPTGEVRLTYDFRDDTRAYWKYTRGWKGGHFNATSSLIQGVSFAEPEENNAYETGIKGAWWDSKIRGSVSFFLYDYSNYQLFTVKNDFSSNPEFVVINASDVQVYGSDVTLGARPFDNTSLNASFTWLESRFVDYVQTQVVRESTNTGVLIREIELNFSGNRLLNSPQFKVTLTAEQTVPLGRYGSLTARWDGAWSDTTYFDATEGRGLPNRDGQTFLPPDTIGQKAFWLHNLLLIYRPPIHNVSVEFFVRNLTDEVYKSFAFDASQFQRTSIFFTGDPRTYGATLFVTF